LRLGPVFPGRFVSAPVKMRSSAAKEVVLEDLESDDRRVLARMTRRSLPGGGGSSEEWEVGRVEVNPSTWCTNAWECVVSAVVASAPTPKRGVEGGRWDEVEEGDGNLFLALPRLLAQLGDPWVPITHVFGEHWSASFEGSVESSGRWQMSGRTRFAGGLPQVTEEAGRAVRDLGRRWAEVEALGLNILHSQVTAHTSVGPTAQSLPLSVALAVPHLVVGFTSDPTFVSFED
ncbi:unnamed protein product, partial [Choristocarpus tenellus]